MNLIIFRFIKQLTINMGIEFEEQKTSEEIIIADKEHHKIWFHAGSRNGITETCARKVITEENIQMEGGEDNQPATFIR